MIWARLPLSLLSPAGPRARLSILIFHRVLPERDPLFPTEVDKGDFERICGWLGSMFNVLPLDQAVTRLAAGSLPERAACITFDDGYADNRTQALPILQRHGLPATFYIATGFLDGGRMWNDTVIESVRRTRQSKLDLRPLGLDGLERFDMATTDLRRTAIETIIRRIKHIRPVERLAHTESIAELAQAELPTDLMMSSAQVREMRQGGMQIGVHTVSHPILATLSADEARREIADCRQTLETLLGERVAHFAYPNGKPGQDYIDDSVRIVRELGFDSAVCTQWGAARQGTDRYQLPRFSPWDSTQPRFGLRMMGNLWKS
ncbi:polysaccharide deacetylase family protein [Ideonella sp. A 288]|uniref:polysaccharide deacetylase family protein n=1 Tax=Ideonella sp. A 288 TaxID=1962181 RepID=UPI001F28F3A8|nr:polysaccharide deacetylase family protein [Ideonella sp. A 288]